MPRLSTFIMNSGMSSPSERDGTRPYWVTSLWKMPSNLDILPKAGDPGA